MNARVRLLALMLLLPGGATTPSVAAQTPPATPGANQPEAPSGVIRGRIFAADTGRPLRRAQVTLTAPELSGPRRTNTSLDGRYEFNDLPEGLYAISVTRSGYLVLRYGQRRPMEQPRPLRLEDKQTIGDVDLALPRTGVITGRVLDDAGEPMASVLVQALRPA